MIDFDRLNRQNFLIASAVQACLGALSPNVRMVSFSYDDERIDLFFDLARDLDEDRDEALDAAEQMSILTENFRVVSHVNLVGERHVPLPKDGRLVVYKQKEA